MKTHTSFWKTGLFTLAILAVATLLIVAGTKPA